MQKKYLKSLLLVLVLFFSITSHAQETTFDKGKKYTIGGIKVTGLKSYNEQPFVFVESGLYKNKKKLYFFPQANKQNTMYFF